MKHLTQQIKNQKKRDKEKEIIGLMIRIYCRTKHNSTCDTKRGIFRKKQVDLCQKCQEVQKYAFQKIDLCPFMETKTFCSACKVHCYSKDMKRNIKEIMRYSGPRMILYHPIIVIRHAIVTIKNMWKIKYKRK